MMDLVRKNGDEIYTDILSKHLGCKVVVISALKGEGLDEAAEEAIKAAKKGESIPLHIFSGEVEHTLAHIEERAIHSISEIEQRWYAIKLFERDQKVLEKLKLDEETLSHIENDITTLEKQLDDDAESIITNERYLYIEGLMKTCYKKKHLNRLTISDKIDKVVTNRILALPIFFVIMWLVYTLSIGTIGDWTVGFMNDTLFGETIIPAVTSGLESLNCAPWLVSLIADGIIGGVGAVLGFVPQMAILFLLLSLLEDCGYMSRVAFIMDKLFRKFGLSGKSFIPLLVASGCGVPGVMASRTIEQERDRRMTIMTTCFIPCGAKMPIVGLIASALFGGSALIATAVYFIGIAAVVVSGIILKKSKAFAGKPAPFVMELPAYHAPVPANILRTTWDRAWSFVKRAGTVILAASIIIWLLNSFSFEDGFHFIADGAAGRSILESMGSIIAVVFKPLGFGNWQSAVATILGLVAKEEVVGVFGSLSSMANPESATGAAFIGQEFFGGDKLSGFSFMIFNLLCAPCFAAMGAIRKEMNNAKWSIGAIAYMTGFAYAMCLVVYQLGTLINGGAFGIGTIAAILTLGAFLFLLFRKNKNKN